ncbi:MAG: glycosyltransferase family 2 protein [Candidatus Sericytochromatia bacterium]|nr:glycosyltransferase family 2 protein [Candidatus Sericytochromatia bacterium]
MSQPTLAIVIVSWNTREDVLACLASLRQAGLAVPHAIWVVDNASTDGSAEAIAASHPEARLISAPTNLGFARGNNVALAQVEADHVLLLNPDTLVAPGQLERLVAHLEAHPRVGAVGPRLVFGDGSYQLSAMPFVAPWDLYWEHARFPAALQPAAQRQPRRLYAFPEAGAREVDMVIGAALMVRREVLSRVGPLDEGYFMYGEEMDWCWRIRQAGWRVEWLADATVTHLGGRAAAHVPLPTIAHRFGSSFRFLRLHRGPRAERWARLAVALASVQNVAWGAVRLALGREPRDSWGRGLAEARVALATAWRGRAAGIGPQGG